MSKCTVEKCSNPRFQKLEQCAFHCNGKDVTKKGYDPTTYANDFYRLFSEYIIEEVGKALPTTLSKEDREDSSEINSLDRDLDLYSQFTGGVPKTIIGKNLSERLRKIQIEIKGIDFPSNDEIKIPYETISVLISIGKLTISDSIIYFKNFNINANIYYNACEFKNNVLINPFPSVSNSETYRYIKCLFKQMVNVEPINDLDTIYSNVFENCIFHNGFLVKNLIIKKQIIKFPDYLITFDGSKHKGCKKDFYKKIKKSIDSYSLLKVVLEGCTIEEDFKLNGLSGGDIKLLAGRGVNIESKDLILKNLIIKDTKFQSKIEIKNRVITRLYFENSNVEKVFDAFGSSFQETYFYKSIFEGFAAFEQVKFGIKDNTKEKYTAVFKYTTFESFSNFREANFYSGLDFERVNLKEQPNFLKAIVEKDNTNRETFRIIKNSFDDVGNKLEANKFFAEEMAVYKKELDDDGDKWDRLVYRANEEISDFGRSYIKPSFLLFLGLIIYTSLLSIHESFFENYDYFLHPWVNCLSIQANEVAKNLLPFSKFLEKKSGIEFVSLLFYIWFGILIWQIVVAVKRHTQR